MTDLIWFGGEELLLDSAGLVFVPAHAALIVADLHLEKGSAFARRGTMLPPYDSHATLQRLKVKLELYSPSYVISLGDGFHDCAGARLITGVAADLLLDLAGRYAFHWIKGNHDPQLPSTLPGDVHNEMQLGGILLRHEPMELDQPSWPVTCIPRPELRIGGGP